MKNQDVTNEYIYKNLNEFFNEFELVKYDKENEKITFVIKLLVNDLSKFDQFQKNLSGELKNLEINYYYSNPVY